MATHAVPPAAVAKSQRINLRASARQEAILRQAAESANTSLTEFILSNAVAQAERVLADRRWFVVSEQQFADFEKLLDEPLPSTKKLEQLFVNEGPLGKPFELSN